MAGAISLGRTLGEGSSATVKAGVDTRTQQRVAVKIFGRRAADPHPIASQIKREIAVLRLVADDPGSAVQRVVNLLEVYTSRQSVHLVLELVADGDLFSVIAQHGRLDEPTACAYFHQVVAGVRHCHRRGVCHRDLKLENLLLDASGAVRISDFGLAAIVALPSSARGRVHEDDDVTTEERRQLHTVCGTPHYAAPEVLLQRPCGYDGFVADAWSCGVVLYVLLAGRLPFEAPSVTDLFRSIVAARSSLLRPALRSHSTHSWSVHKRTLSEKPSHVQRGLSMHSLPLCCTSLVDAALPVIASLRRYEVPSGASSGACALLRAILVPSPTERHTLQQIGTSRWIQSQFVHAPRAQPPAIADDNVGASPPQPPTTPLSPTPPTPPTLPLPSRPRRSSQRCSTSACGDRASTSGPCFLRAANGSATSQASLSVQVSAFDVLARSRVFDLSVAESVLNSASARPTASWHGSTTSADQAGY